MKIPAFIIILALIIFPFSIPEKTFGATDVLNDASLGANLTAAWFGKNEALTVDLTGNGNTLTDAGAGTVDLVASPNTGESAADFEAGAGSTTYFTRADTADISFTSAFSHAFWFKPESNPSQAWIRKYDGAGERDYINEWQGASGDKIAFQYYDGSSYRLALSSAVTNMSNGTWYHIAVTFNAGTTKIYLDGSQLGTDLTPGGTAIADGSGTLYIGSANGSSQYVDGVMHQLLFYDKVLTSTDVSNLYNSGTELPFDAGGAAEEGEEQAVWFMSMLLAPPKGFFVV